MCNLQKCSLCIFFSLFFIIISFSFSMVQNSYYHDYTTLHVWHFCTTRKICRNSKRSLGYDARRRTGHSRRGATFIRVTFQLGSFRRHPALIIFTHKYISAFASLHGNRGIFLNVSWGMLDESAAIWRSASIRKDTRTTITSWIHINPRRYKNDDCWMNPHHFEEVQERQSSDKSAPTRRDT